MNVITYLFIKLELINIKKLTQSAIPSDMMESSKLYLNIYIHLQKSGAPKKITKVCIQQNFDKHLSDFDNSFLY